MEIEHLHNNLVFERTVLPTIRIAFSFTFLLYFDFIPSLSLSLARALTRALTHFNIR